MVTADDFGCVKLFNFPCLVEDSPFVEYNGHSSHVSSVVFLGDDRRVVTTGSADRAVFVWRYDEGTLERGVMGGGGSDDEEEGVLPESQLELVRGYELQIERAREEEQVRTRR